MHCITAFSGHQSPYHERWISSTILTHFTMVNHYIIAHVPLIFECLHDSGASQGETFSKLVYMNFVRAGCSWLLLLGA